MAATDEEQEPRNLEESLMVFSNLGRTVDGVGLAYRSVDCVFKRIGVIKPIEAYSHLHHIDLSQNMIKDVAPLKGLKFLLKLNLAQNEIKELKSWEPGEEEEVFPQLVSLDLSHNSLLALPTLHMKQLRTANFAKNDISTCQDFPGHATLRQLDLSENRLATLGGVANLPSLTKLDVSGQREALPPEEKEQKKGAKEKQEESKEILPPGLPDITGLAEVPNLVELNAARNRMEGLTGELWGALAMLKTLDLSKNHLAEAKPLEVLRQLPKLRSLKVAGNPFAEAGASDAVPGGARTQVIVCHWRLTDIDGAPVTEEEREFAKEENVKQLLEERERLAAEAAKAAEAEGAEG